MKKLLLVLSLLILSTFASAQYTYQIVLRNAAAPSNTTSGNIIGSGAAFHNLTWNVSGTVSTCSVRVDSSVDGITWSTGDVIGATTCTSNGNTLSASHVVNYVRINLVTFTGTTPVFTANLSGYITQPSGGGTVTSVTCGTGLSGGTITSTGTCNLANTAVTPGSYTNGNFTVDQQGRLTTASSNTATSGCATTQANSGFVCLESHTASSSATLNFTTFITSTYDDYTCKLVNVIPGTATTDLLVRVSTDGGSTFQATNYFYSIKYVPNTGVEGILQGNSATAITLFTAITNTVANGGVSGSFNIVNPLSSTTWKQTNFHVTAAQSAAAYNGNGSGTWATTTAINSIQFLFSSGNIAQGTIRCGALSK